MEEIIDGRNRLAACKIAGIKPTFEKLNGHDPVAFIISANLTRRNLSVGQHAMLYAMNTEPEQGKRTDLLINDKRLNKIKKLSASMQVRVSQCRSVLRFSRQVAADIVKGITSLASTAPSAAYPRFSGN